MLSTAGGSRQAAALTAIALQEGWISSTRAGSLMIGLYPLWSRPSVALPEENTTAWKPWPPAYYGAASPLPVAGCAKRPFSPAGAVSPRARGIIEPCYARNIEQAGSAPVNQVLGWKSSNRGRLISWSSGSVGWWSIPNNPYGQLVDIETLLGWA